MSWWTDSSKYKNFDAIICDGAVRSGKTVSEALSFVLWAMYRFDGKNFALCGKTVGGLRRNVIGPLKQMIKSLGYQLEDARNDGYLCIGYTTLDTQGKKITKTNYFYIFGGKDESSQDLIQGITLAGVFFDEVALMPESFVNQATGRCSILGAKLWFNCNPERPGSGSGRRPCPPERRGGNAPACAWCSYRRKRPAPARRRRESARPPDTAGR